MTFLTVTLFTISAALCAIAEDAAGDHPILVDDADPKLMDVSPWTWQADDDWGAIDFLKHSVPLTVRHFRALEPLCGIAKLHLRDAVTVSEPVHKATRLFASFCDFTHAADGSDLRAALRYADLSAALRQWDLDTRHEALRSFAYIDVDDAVLARIVQDCRDVIGVDLRLLAGISSDLVVSYLDLAFPYNDTHHETLIRAALTTEDDDDADDDFSVRSLLAAAPRRYRPYLCADFAQYRLLTSRTVDWAVLKPFVVDALQLPDGTWSESVENLRQLTETYCSSAEVISKERAAEWVIYTSLCCSVTDLDELDGNSAVRRSLLSTLSHIIAHADHLSGDRVLLIAMISPHLKRLVQLCTPEELLACWPQPNSALRRLGFLGLLNGHISGDMLSYVSVRDLVSAVADALFPQLADRVDIAVTYLDLADIDDVRDLSPEFLLAGLCRDQIIEATVQIMDRAAMNFDTQVMALTFPRWVSLFTQLCAFTQGIWDDLVRALVVQHGRSASVDFDFNCVLLLGRTAPAARLHTEPVAQLLHQIVLNLESDPSLDPSYQLLLDVLPRLRYDQLRLVLPGLLDDLNTTHVTVKLDLYDRICVGLRDPRQRAALYSAALSSMSLSRWMRWYRSVILASVAEYGLPSFLQLWRPEDDTVADNWRRAVCWMLWVNGRGHLLDTSMLEDILYCTDLLLTDAEANAALQLLARVLQTNPNLSWRKTPFIRDALQTIPSSMIVRLNTQLHDRVRDEAHRQMMTGMLRDLLLELIAVNPDYATRLFRSDTLGDSTSYLFSLCLDQLLVEFKSELVPDLNENLFEKAANLVAALPSVCAETDWLQSLLVQGDFLSEFVTGRRRAYIALTTFTLPLRKTIAWSITVLIRSVSDADLAAHPAETRRMFCVMLQVPSLRVWMRDELRHLIRHISWAALMQDDDFLKLLPSLSVDTVESVVRLFLSDRTLSDSDRRALAEAYSLRLQAESNPDNALQRLDRILSVPFRLGRGDSTTASAAVLQKGHFLLDFLQDMPSWTSTATASCLLKFITGLSAPDRQHLLNDPQFSARLNSASGTAVHDLRGQYGQQDQTE